MVFDKVLHLRLLDLLYLIPDVPAEFIGKVESYIQNISTFDIVSFLIGISCILILVYWPKVNKKVPASIIALIVSTLAVNLLNLPTDTIGTRFSEISSSIPKPQIPHMDVKTIIKIPAHETITYVSRAGIFSWFICCCRNPHYNLTPDFFDILMIKC